MSDDEQFTRKLPINELDLQFMSTDPAWGKEVTKELNVKLSKIDPTGTIKEGANESEIKEHLWGLLSYYTRDLRLSNINNDKFLYTQFWLDLAGDCLRDNYIYSFMTAFTKVITVMELSQSVGGFLRRRNNTVTQEHYGHIEQQKKKGLFGDKVVKK